jgi:hypothetical protein
MSRTAYATETASAKYKRRIKTQDKDSGRRYTVDIAFKAAVKPVSATLY